MGGKAGQGGPDAQADVEMPGGSGRSQSQSSGPTKPFVWLHPPSKIELLPHDELFVLSDRSLMETLKDEEAAGSRQFVDSSKLLKNEEKKTQEANVNKLREINKRLTDLSQASKEWEKDVE